MAWYSKYKQKYNNWRSRKKSSNYTVSNASISRQVKNSLRGYKASITRKQKKQTTMFLLIGAIAIGAWFFRDKIKALFNKTA